MAFTSVRSSSLLQLFLDLTNLPKIQCKQMMRSTRLTA
uniref:Uncharacterized protein n=1 Tax=Arundo donax TaxID=35708 RepID=A0A0A8YE54_ARUDO